jgi:hypothetical protein
MTLHVGGGLLGGVVIEAFKAMPAMLRRGLFLAPPVALSLSPKLRSKSASIFGTLMEGVAEQQAAAGAAEGCAAELRGELLDLVRGLRQAEPT